MNVDLSAIVLAAYRGDPCPSGCDADEVAVYERMVKWFSELPPDAEVDWEWALTD